MASMADSMDTYREVPDHLVHRPAWRADGVMRARHPLRIDGKDYAPGDWIGTHEEIDWDVRLMRIHWEQQKVDTYDPALAPKTNAALASIPPVMTQAEAKIARAALKRR